MRFLFALMFGLWPITACSGLADVVARVTPTVVFIQVGEQGACAGVVMDALRRRVVTAKHCIQGDQKEFRLLLSNGVPINAKLIGVSKNVDIAVLEVIGPVFLIEARAGNAKTLRAGDSVFAIGHPYRNIFSVSAGIVSFIDRDDNDPSGLHIQSDAAVNPGNSGGPLFDFNGLIVGINDSMFGLRDMAGRMGSIGISYAIPIHTVLAAVEEIG